jgi:hypothetical protein
VTLTDNPGKGKNVAPPMAGETAAAADNPSDADDAARASRTLGASAMKDTIDEGAAMEDPETLRSSSTEVTE